jgi:hypothetical protein
LLLKLFSNTVDIIRNIFSLCNSSVIQIRSFWVIHSIMSCSVLSSPRFQVVDLLEVRFLIHQRFCSLRMNIISDLIWNISKLVTSIFIHCEYTLFVAGYIIGNFCPVLSDFHSIHFLFCKKVGSKLTLLGHFLSFHVVHVGDKSGFSFGVVDSFICFFFFLL